MRIIIVAALIAAPAAAQTNLPEPFPPFGGEVRRTYQDSTPDWPDLPAPPADAPNVVVILLDDLGFGQPSTFGG